MQNRAGQSAQPSAQLEDRQLLQIMIDDETDGQEFEFSTDFLAKQIILRGYSIYCNLDQKVPYEAVKGHFAVDIQWLRVDGVAVDAQGHSFQVQKIVLPFAYDGIESNTAMSHSITLPSQTSLRKRFKASIKALIGPAEVPFSSIHPNLVYRVVLHIEVVHNHIFK